MGKYVTRSEYAILREQFKKDKKKTVLCHGVFDLVHPGHIIHFEEAKAQGDILVVSITSEDYVRKGIGRPYFNDDLRVKYLTALEIVDYVLISEEHTVHDIMEAVRPDLYIKGNEYAKFKDDITGMISEEVALVRHYGGDVYFTSGQTFSSTKLINNGLSYIPEETKKFLKQILEKNDFSDVKRYINKLEGLKVLVVGDIIIDEYNFCSIQGLMSKDLGYSARSIRNERYLGGVLAVARQISEFTENVTLCTIAGENSELNELIQEDLGERLNLDLMVSRNYETIIKKRYVHEDKKREELRKLLSITNIPEDTTLETKLEQDFVSKINRTIKDYDVVVVCDFGHGIISDKVQDLLERESKFLAINCQTNSSNHGMNLISKYRRADTYALDQKELKLAFSGYNKKEIDSVVDIYNHFGTKGFLTRGSEGAYGIDAEAQVVECPAFTLTVRDTIGAGDAFYSLVSILMASDTPIEVSLLLGNIAGALATGVSGNKTTLNKVDILKFASTLLNI